MNEKTPNLQHRYGRVIADLQVPGTLNQDHPTHALMEDGLASIKEGSRGTSIKESNVWSVEGMALKIAVHPADAKKRRIRATRYCIVLFTGLLVLFPTLSTLHPSPAYAWRWDEEEADSKDELDAVSYTHLR